MPKKLRAQISVGWRENHNLMWQEGSKVKYYSYVNCRVIMKIRNKNVKVSNVTKLLISHSLPRVNNFQLTLWASNRCSQQHHASITILLLSRGHQAGVFYLPRITVDGKGGVGGEEWDGWRGEGKEDNVILDNLFHKTRLVKSLLHAVISFELFALQYVALE